MAEESLYEAFVGVLKQIATEIASSVPKIALAIVVFLIAVFVISLLNRAFGRILKFVDLDGMVKRLLGTDFPLPLGKFIIVLMDLGIFLIAVFGVANLFLGPEHLGILREILTYGGRIVSVIVVMIITFLMFTLLIDRMTVETRTKGYVMFVLLILLTMMIIDLTNLGTATKIALVQGLSIGLAMAIGVFAVWFFFHDYLDRFFDSKRTANVEKEKGGRK